MCYSCVEAVMKRYKVSIIIPTYNSAKYLPRAIDSCIQQTYKDFEVVIVNDGSSDNTIDVVNIYRENYDFIRLVNEENSGSVIARDTGVNNASGDFLFFMDADDVIDCDALMVLMTKVDVGDIVIGDFVIVNDNGDINRFQHTNKFRFGEDAQAMYSNYLMKSISPSLCGRLYRKSLFDYLEIDHDLSIGEDVFTNMMIVYNNPQLKVVIINKPIYHYIQHSSSMVHVRSEYNLSQRIKYVNKVITFFQKNNLIISDIVLSRFVMEEYYIYFNGGGNPAFDWSFYHMTTDTLWRWRALLLLPPWISLSLIVIKYFPSASDRLRAVLGKFKSMLG